MTSSARDRVSACVAERSAARPPIMLWRHWPGDDQELDSYWRRTRAFQDEFDLDIIKLCPSGTYLSESWGTQATYQGDLVGTRQAIRAAITSERDLAAITTISPSESIEMTREIDCVSLASREYGSDAVILPTLFTPLSVLRHLCGHEQLVVLARNHPAAFRSALDAITSSLECYVDRLISAGAAGIYLSAWPASYRIFSETEYRDMNEEFDRRVLDSAGSAQLRVLHLHMPDPILGLGVDYPCNAVSWEPGPQISAFREGAEYVKRTVVGGLDQWGAISLGSRTDVVSEVRQAVAALAGLSVIFGTYCSLPIYTPGANIRALVAEVRS